MSLAKTLAGYIISVLFIISLYFTITSYTIGDLIQKDNIKNFVQTQLEGNVTTQTCEDYCSDEKGRCEEYCNELVGELKQMCENECMQTCIQECLSQSNETEEYVYKTVDDIYANKIIGNLSLEELTLLFRNTLMFLVLSLVFGVLIFFVSDKPISKIGNNIVVVSISLLSMAIIPVFIITPDVPIIEMVTNYIIEGLYQQLTIGVVLIIIGIILLVIAKFLEKRKLKKMENGKSEKKK